MLTFGYLYDFHNPPQWYRRPAELYAETLDIIAGTEALGFAGAWLPEHQPGSHLTANHVRIRLKKLGFPSLSTRIGTWQSITQTTPPPVLADALGLNPQTAIRHARRRSGQYGAYVADRIHADT